MFVQLKKNFQGQTPGARIDVAEADAQTLIESGIAEAVQGDPLAPLLQKSMEGMLANLTKTLNDTIDAALKEFAKAQTKSRKNAVPAIFGDTGEGDPKKTFGQFLLAVRHKNVQLLEEMGSKFAEWDTGQKASSMSTQTGTTGGYLVPTEFYAKLMALVTEMSIVRPRATIIPMGARTTQVPALDVTTAPQAGDTAFLGGVVARWTEEATATNKTNPNLKQIDITNYELSGYTQVSNTLLADAAIGLEAFLFQVFARAIAWYEDYAFLRGDGVKKPLGVQSWPGFLKTNRNTPSHIKLADFGNVFGSLIPGGNPASVCWIVHPTVLTELVQMTGGQNVLFLLGQNIGGKITNMALGHEIEISEKVPALGTAGDLGLYDFSQYLIGDRQQVEIAFSDQVAFLSNESVWRFVSRVGGQPWLKDAVTLADTVTKLSPFAAVNT
jgi:HK97 family phage major capsid protein